VDLRKVWFVAVLIVLAAVGWPATGLGHKTGEGGRLSKIGPAPAFALTDQEGKRLSLRALRGKVVAVTFIYTTCADTCPLLTAKMASIQERLGRDFGTRVRFVSITVDPEVDTPDALRQYARARGTDVAGWSFLTGTAEDIREVTRRYGVFARKAAQGDVDHTFLTSLVDRNGVLRVQYLGVRFDPDEMLRDLRSLLQKDPAR